MKKEKGYLDKIFEAAQECTGEKMPDIWEWRGTLHLEGKCKNCKYKKKEIDNKGA